MARVITSTPLPAGLRLRPMRTRDLDAVRAIESEVYRRGWSREVFASELDRRDGRHYLVATVPDGWWGLRRRIVGYGGSMTVGDEVHITTVVVTPDVRRRGVASVVLTTLLERAVERGSTAATLEVRAGNEAARRLYRRFGFAPVGTRRGYYPDGPAGDAGSEDAVIMWLHDLAEGPHAAHAQLRTRSEAGVSVRDGRR